MAGMAVEGVELNENLVAAGLGGLLLLKIPAAAAILNCYDFMLMNIRNTGVRLVARIDMNGQRVCRTLRSDGLRMPRSFSPRALISDAALRPRSRLSVQP
jgi:hypothetical protein